MSALLQAKAIMNGTTVGEFEIEKGRTLATVALAEEQARAADALETANLIAYLAISGNSESAAIPVPVNVLKSVQADVETRLGLA